jgi:hypothetical protein
MSWSLIPWSESTHKKMTYLELLEQLQRMAPDVLKQKVTIYSIANDRFIPAYSTDYTAPDSLDIPPNHFVITY